MDAAGGRRRRGARGRPSRTGAPTLCRCRKPIRSVSGHEGNVRGRVQPRDGQRAAGPAHAAAVRRDDRQGPAVARGRAASLLVRQRAVREGARRRQAGAAPRLAVARGRRIPAGDRGRPRRLGDEIRFRAGDEARRRAPQAAAHAAESADAAVAAPAKARRETRQARRMRFLRPDLLGWALVVPVLVAVWAAHWQVTRAFRRRARIAARFDILSRRSTWRRDAAVLAGSVTAALAIVFALMRPQVLRAERVPVYEQQDLIVMLDRSVSMRARDIQPSRFERATQELRTLLRRKPEGIDRIALVGFADSSLVLSYLTNDLESVMFYLDRIDEDAAVLFGTNIGAALKSAIDVAKKDDRKTRKSVPLMSDGEEDGAEMQ